MASKIDSESDEEHFETFMKINKPKINLLDNTPSTSASTLFAENKDENEDVVVNGSKRNAKKRKPITKRKTKKEKLQNEETNHFESMEEADDIQVIKPTRKRKVTAAKRQQRKASELIFLSDDDSTSSKNNYGLRPKCKKITEADVVTVVSSSAETTSALAEEEVVGHLPILETVEEELEMDQCDCCKVAKKNCTNRLNTREDLSRKSLLKDLKTLQESNQNTVQFIRQQHRNLLKHPEMDSLCSSIDDSQPSNFLTQEKREWIEKFMDSMLADRIDYVKPNQVNSVQGLQHSSVETDTPVSEADHLSDSNTIVKRIDFEKEKKARLSQLLQKQRSSLIIEPATPSFCANQLLATSTPIVAGSILPSKSRRSEEDNIDLSKLDFSFVTLRTPMKSNANEEQKNSRMVVEKTNVEEAREVPVNNSPEDLPMPATTDDLPPEGNIQNVPNNSYIPRHLRPAAKPMNEDEIMNFVDDLLGSETAVIAQLVDDNFDRIMKYNQRVKSPISENVVNLIDDIYNSAIDDSVILIDDNVNPEDDNSVQILDDTASPIIIDDTIVMDVPSTSNRSKRKQGILNSSPPKRRRVLPINMDSVPSNHSEVGKRDCPICLEPMDKKEVSSTVCGHIFCTSCIKEAIRKTKKCPNCRKALNLKKIHPLYL